MLHNGGGVQDRLRWKTWNGNFMTVTAACVRKTKEGIDRCAVEQLSS